MSSSDESAWAFFRLCAIPLSPPKFEFLSVFGFFSHEELTVDRLASSSIKYLIRFSFAFTVFGDAIDRAALA
jgi:hypothetical protein